MPDTLTSRERFARMFAHRDADRVPIIDSPWGATIERWCREGMPEGMDFREFFGLDITGHIGVDTSPRYECKTIEETDEYTVYTTAWGVTQKNWRHAASTPEFLAHTIVDRPSWERAKARMTPSRDRVDWDGLKRNYPQWRENDAWTVGGLWFGFDVTHSWMVGTERVLMAFMEDPEWLREMWMFQVDFNLALFDMVWAEGYTVDSVMWPDDMGYKNNTFFSVDTYREFLRPAHQRAVEWAHAKGIKAHLHSCGNIMPFVPDLIEIGVDALNPLEVKAGMDPIHMKRTYGDDLVLHGGINAVLWDDLEAIEAEMRKTLPVVKENGGYIFSSDHSVPSSVSLENFRRIVGLAKELGSYD
ncbi:MAG: hypothetical protein JXR94_25060 [Candidatus Hydrogenedentes bacterium]|nr:hypothetical protein [Candidatus Hydrogenedentota bacterium]